MFSKILFSLKSIHQRAYKNLLVFKRFNLKKLVETFPAQFEHSHKQYIYGLVNQESELANKTLKFYRWREFSLPKTFINHANTDTHAVSGMFSYTEKSEHTVDWHVNFAHSHLFIAYGSELFAQDEMQVMEHPVLGSLREALLTSKIKPLTVANGKPTPILIQNVPRQCTVATEANTQLKRPQGLYGNAFAHADIDAIKLAVSVIQQPTLSNIIAMEALTEHIGSYTEAQIRYVLTTAYTGFKAAKLLSKNNKTIIHSGFWGCGAYGGNKVMMLLAQMIAAKLANIDKLVLYVINEKGEQDYAEALRVFKLHFSKKMPMTAVIQQITAMKFKGGFSDGN